MKIIVNRIPDYYLQIEDYWFRAPQRRFAADAGVSESSFSRLLRGQAVSDYRIICKIVAHIEHKLQTKLDLRDVYQVE